MAHRAMKTSLAVLAAGAALAAVPATAQAVPAGDVTVQLGVDGTPLDLTLTVEEPQANKVEVLLAPGQALTGVQPPATPGNIVGGIEDKFYGSSSATTTIGAHHPVGDLTDVNVQQGGSLTFDVDGFHQPLLYRLSKDESYEAAYGKLDAIARTSSRMASGTTALTEADTDKGFRYLGHLLPTGGVTFLSTGAMRKTMGDPGDYIALCNIAGHYKNFGMRTRVHVHPKLR